MSSGTERRIRLIGKMLEVTEDFVGISSLQIESGGSLIIENAVSHPMIPKLRGNRQAGIAVGLPVTQQPPHRFLHFDRLSTSGKLRTGSGVRFSRTGLFRDTRFRSPPTLQANKSRCGVSSERVAERVVGRRHSLTCDFRFPKLRFFRDFV